MVALISHRRQLLAAVALVLTAALVASCGSGSGKAKPTATEVAYPTLSPIPIKTPPPTPDVNAPTGLTKFAFVDRGDGWAIASCRYKPCDIVATQDGGRTWHIQYRTSLDLVGIQFVESAHGFAFGPRIPEDGALTPSLGTIILATSDGGETWQTRLEAPAMSLTDIKFVTPLVGYGLVSNTVFKTTDGGATWQAAAGAVTANGQPNCGFRDLSFISPSRGWAAGNISDPDRGPCLYETVDGGMTWITSFLEVDSAPIKSALEVVIRPWADVFQLKDEASIIARARQDCGLYGVDFTSTEDGWLTFGSGDGATVMRTTDAGATWQFVWGQDDCLNQCQLMTNASSPIFF